MKLCLFIYGKYALDFVETSLSVASYYISNYGIANGIQLLTYYAASGQPNRLNHYGVN